MISCLRASSIPFLWILVYRYLTFEVAHNTLKSPFSRKNGHWMSICRRIRLKYERHSTVKLKKLAYLSLDVITR